NGTSAPGNVLPPPEVQVRVSTSVAGLGTVFVTVEWSLTPRGSDLGSAAGQCVMRPALVIVQRAERGWRMTGWLTDARGSSPVGGAAVAAEPGRGAADAGTAAANARAVIDAMPSAM